MPKPRKRLPTAKLEKFGEVRPMSHLTDDIVIPEFFAEAVEALADWAGPDWSSHEKTAFFLLRNRLSSAVEAWRKFDWPSSKRLLDDQRNEQRAAQELMLSFDKFCLDLPDDKSVLLGQSIFGALLPDYPLLISEKDYADKVKRGLDIFKKTMPFTVSRNARYGPLEYEGFPAIPPAPEIAIAIVLCDIVTRFRADVSDAGYDRVVRKSGWSGVKPRFSENLPWKAIGLFVVARPNGFNEEFDPARIQTRVESAVKNVVALYPTPFNVS